MADTIHRQARSGGHLHDTHTTDMLTPVRTYLEAFVF